VLSASIPLMMEVVNTSETSVNFYETALRNTPEDVHLQLLTCLGLGQSVTWLRAVRMSAWRTPRPDRLWDPPERVQWGTGLFLVCKTYRLICVADDHLHMSPRVPSRRAVYAHVVQRRMKSVTRLLVALRPVHTAVWYWTRDPELADCRRIVCLACR
jgi:hypothetical protein